MKNLGIQQIAAFHNEFSLYTFTLFIFSTAMRVVENTRFIGVHFDRETSSYGIKDKEKEAGDNTRVVILPSITQQQLDFYQSHFNFLYDKVSLFCPSLLNFVVARGIEEASQTFFFIDANPLRIQLFNQAILEKTIRDKYGYFVPLNSNRHFLRSSLIERRCEIELVDLFMGHTDHPCGAWVKDMAIFSFDLHKMIEDHLVPLLEETGWKVLPGLGAKRK